MSYVPLGNPILSAQFHILGGPRRAAYTVGIYSLLLLGAVMLWARTNHGLTPAVAYSALRLLGVVQIGLLVLGGSGAMHRALQRDYTTRMVDTLRTSSLRTGGVLAGYLLGGPLQMLLLFGIGAIGGAILMQAAGAGAAIGSWLAGQLIVLLVAASIWSAAVFLGVGTCKPASISVLVIILAVTVQLWANFVPGIGLLTGACAAVSSWHVMQGRFGAPSGLGVQVGITAAMTAFWLAAAARRFRRPWLPPLDPVAALLLVVAVCACAMIGLIRADDMLPATLQPDPHAGLFYTALMMPLLVLHLPAQMAIQGRRRILLGARPHATRELWPPVVWAVLSAAAAFGAVMLLRRLLGTPEVILTRQREPFSVSSTWALAGCAYVSAALLTCGLFKAAVFRTGRTGLAAVAAVLLWATPPAFDVMRLVATSRPYDSSAPDLSALFVCSPIGTLVAAWEPDPPPLWFGLSIQAAIAAAALTLGWYAEQSLRKSAHTLPPPDAG